MPLTFLPYMILFLTTPNMWQSFSSVSAISSNGQFQVCLNLSCDAMLSRDTPNTTAPALTNSLCDRGTASPRWCNRACCPSGRNTAPRSCRKSLRRELHAAGRERFKFREGFVEGWRHGVFCLVAPRAGVAGDYKRSRSRADPARQPGAPASPPRTAGRPAPIGLPPAARCRSGRRLGVHGLHADPLADQRPEQRGPASAAGGRCRRSPARA